MAIQTSPYEAIGVLTLSDLAEKSGVPEGTIRDWAKRGHVHVIRDPFGTFRSTLIEVNQAARNQKARGNPRRWEIAPELIEQLNAEEAELEAAGIGRFALA